jgi:hypothetical protein
MSGTSMLVLDIRKEIVLILKNIWLKGIQGLFLCRKQALLFPLAARTRVKSSLNAEFRHYWDI